MKQGFKATLFAGVITFGVMAPAFAAAPVITDIPDVTIGDLEGSTENNVFEYEAPFSLNDKVEYDGDKADLLWSFGESDADGLATNQYTINGVGAAVSGDTALADEEASPSLTLNPATPIDGSSSTTLYRDIVLSPPADSAPYDDPSSGDAATAAEGKLITYFVSDGANVDSQVRLVKSVDNAADTLTGSEGWDVVVSDSDFGDWVASGIQSEGVTIAKGDGELNITVAPTVGLGRVYGWQNPEMLNYDDVGADKVLRAKFYISASNAMTAPINEVPNFRLRVFNTAAVDAAGHFEYAQTAFASPSHEPRYNDAANPAVEVFSKWLRPSDSAETPSLYRVDFDPVDVTEAEDTPIGALLESYSYNDPANGTLSLHEVVLGTYDALQDSEGELIFDYDAFGDGMDAAAVGGEKAMSGGAFNAEANFEAGRRQKLWVASANDVPPSGGYSVNIDFPGIGVVATSRFASTDLFAMDLLNVQSIDGADRPRLEAGKLYKARFYAQGILPATAPEDQVVQGPMRFRFQTAGGTVSYLYELLGASGLGNLSEDGKADALAAAAGPSKDSTNPDTDPAYQIGEVLGATPAGGWYNIIVSSPLNEDGIREDTEDFGDLADQPGPGEAGDSARDILLGVDLIQAPTHLTITGSEGPVTVQFNQPNHSEVGISAIKLYEFTDIEDGGYEFDGSSTVE